MVQAPRKRDDKFAERRAELQQAIATYCRKGVYETPEPQRPRNLFEALFGIEPTRPMLPPSMPELDTPLEPLEQRTARWGSGRPVCVRACDGYFFPLPTSSGGREGAEEMCQALCPASETKLFYMGGSGEIENAAGRDEAYADLPNAGRYLKTFDATCGCRKKGESWASTLAEAEEMLVRRKGDLIVSAAKAEELSRPRETKKEREKRLAAEKALAERNANVEKEEAALGAAAPTAGKESAGIGPQRIGGGGVIGIDEGKTQKVTSATGETRTVRFVAPAITPQDGSARPDPQSTSSTR